MQSLDEKCHCKEGKQDDSDALSVDSTDRTCAAYLLNNWDADITNIVFTHISGGKTDVLPSVSLLKQGESSIRITINYNTGFCCNHDYWYVYFEAKGGKHQGKWMCKNNFYCDLREGDAGTVVQAMLSANDGCMYITESSGQCYVGLYHPQDLRT